MVIFLITGTLIYDDRNGVWRLNHANSFEISFIFSYEIQFPRKFLRVLGVCVSLCIEKSMRKSEGERKSKKDTVK